MLLESILTPTLMRSHIPDISTKKKVLEEISSIISEADDRIKFPDVIEALQKRERLGSTAIGYGVAIPHARIKNLKKAACVIITLENPVDFDSAEEIHNQPVDLIFSLLVPEEATQEHLDLLSDIAIKLKDKSYRDALRAAETDDSLFKVARHHLAHHHPEH